MYFRCFVIISPWIRAWPFIWTNLNPLYPRILCAMFGWFWRRRWTGEKFIERHLQTDSRMDDRRLENLPWAFSSGELKTTVGASLRSEHVVNNSISLMDECWVIFWVNVSMQTPTCCRLYKPLSNVGPESSRYLGNPIRLSNIRRTCTYVCFILTSISAVIHELN